MSVLSASDLSALRHERDRRSALLAAAENGTLDAIAALEGADGEGVFARDLSRVLDVTHAAACMRLERLHLAGFLTRSYVRLKDGGGRAWRYSLSRDSVRSVST